jgi:hypothetical protein
MPDLDLKIVKFDSIMIFLRIEKEIKIRIWKFSYLRNIQIWILLRFRKKKLKKKKNMKL